MTARWALPLAVQQPAGRGLWGVEQEYQVYAGGRQVDFRLLLDDLAGGLGRRDPGDPRARRIPLGLGLTADGWEAEIVTPTLEVGPDGLAELAALVSAGEEDVATALSAGLPGHRLMGFSTHVNVSVPDAEVVRVADDFARFCAATFDAVVRPPDRSGVLVRPRRGRLEVGCDHLSGPALLMAVAVVAACVRGLLAGGRPPVARESVAVPSREKFGFYVAPDNLGPATPAAATWVDDNLTALGLPTISGPAVVGEDWLDRGRRSAPHPFLDLGPRERRGLRLSSAWLTWEHSVWVANSPGRGRTCYAVFPVATEPAFLAALDAGHLDEALERAVRSRRRRVLVTHDQIGEPSLWSDLRPEALVPAERLVDGSVPLARRSMAMSVWRRPDRSSPRRAWS